MKKNNAQMKKINDKLKEIKDKFENKEFNEIEIKSKNFKISIFDRS